MFTSATYEIRFSLHLYEERKCYSNLYATHVAEKYSNHMIDMWLMYNVFDEVLGQTG